MKYIAIIATIYCVVTIPSSAFAGCGKFCASPSTQSVDIKFENKTGGAVNVIWYTFDGGMKIYRVLAHTQSYVQPSVLGDGCIGSPETIRDPHAHPTNSSSK